MSYKCRLPQERYLFCSACEPGGCLLHEFIVVLLHRVGVVNVVGVVKKKCLGCLEISEILLYYAIRPVKESRTMPGFSESGFAQEKFAKSNFFAYICNSKRDKRNNNE